MHKNYPYNSCKPKIIQNSRPQFSGQSHKNHANDTLKTDTSSAAAFNSDHSDKKAVSKSISGGNYNPISIRVFNANINGASGHKYRKYVEENNDFVKGSKEEEQWDKGPKDEEQWDKGPKDEDRWHKCPKDEEHWHKCPKDDDPWDKGLKDEDRWHKCPKDDDLWDKGPKDEDRWHKCPKDDDPWDKDPKDEEQWDKGPKDEEQWDKGPKDEEQWDKGPKDEEQWDKGPKDEKQWDKGSKDEEHGDSDADKSKYGHPAYCGCAPCKPLHPIPQPVILACGHGGAVAITPGDTAATYDAGFVHLDTACLCQPVVKINYSANILVDTGISTGLANDVVLTFALQTVCNGVTNTLDTFIYRREFALNDEELGTLATQDSFCFTFCDHAYPGYCLYRVVITATVGADVIAVTVGNIHINAIAQ